MADVIEVNAETGEVTERGFTAEEIAQREADHAAAVEAQADAEAQAALAESARQKIAESSGLTPDEMAALGF